MDLRKILEEADFEGASERIERYIETTKKEALDEAADRAIYLSLGTETAKLFTKERIRLLNALRDEGPIGVTELADHLDRHLDAVSRDLRLLAHEGVIELVRDEKDGRRKLAQLVAREIRIQLLGPQASQDKTLFEAEQESA